MTEMNYMTEGKADGIMVSEIITAALPRLEAAWREVDVIPIDKGLLNESRIRADERAQVRERVEAERLEDTDNPLAGLSATGRAADRAYNQAIDDALAAIEGTDDE